MKKLEQALQSYARDIELPAPAGYRLEVRAWQSRTGVLGQALIYAPLGALYLVLVAESLRYSIKYHAQSVGYLGFSLSLVAACLILFIYSQEWRHEELVERFLESERQDASREQAAKRRP